MAKALDVPQSGDSYFSKEWNYLLYENYIARRADWLPNCSKKVSDHGTTLIPPFVPDFLFMFIHADGLERIDLFLRVGAF